MEQKKSISIFSAVALFLYISSIVFFCISLISEYKTAERHVETRFKKLAKSTADIYKAETKSTATFTNSMLQIINSTSDIAAVFVLSGGETIFEWPQSNNFDASSPLLKSCSTTISQDGAGAVTLTASLYVLKPESIYKTAKISFIVVLAATLCTVVFFVYINITTSMPSEKPFADIPKFSRKKQTKTEEPNLSTQSDGFSDVVTFSPISEISPTLASLHTISPFENDKESESEKGGAEREKSATSTFSPVSIINDPEAVSRTFSNRLDEEPYTLTKETISPVSMTQTDTAFTLVDETMSGKTMVGGEQANEAEAQVPPIQNSRYSPFTGFSWESFIDVSTQEALQDAIEQGKDVSLMFMRISGLDRMDYISESVRSVLFNAIANRDLLFEYKTDGYAVLLPQTDIDGAIKIAELIEPKVSEVLQAQNFPGQLMIGIAARTQRMIDASVLHEEAEKALAHADSSLPLIAFRVDPEKYKEFVEQQTLV